MDGKRKRSNKKRNTMKTEKEIIESAYDYIVKVTMVQGKLLPADLLYGDGTRWQHRRDIFKATYNQIKNILELNLIKL